MTEIKIVIGIVKNAADEIFITRRHSNLHQGGFWEFAGGKVEENESLETALRRELKEEIGIDIISFNPLIQLKHDYSDKKVHLFVFEITQYQGEPKSLLEQEIAWVKKEQFSNYSFPAANRAILNALQLPDFYAILDDGQGDLFEQFQHLIDQKIKLIQARLKNKSEKKVRNFLEIIYPICRENGVILLVNSGVINAEKMPCDGIHLTSSDLLKYKKFEKLSWLSASCHTREELHYAEKMNVDFVVLSPILNTETHPNKQPLGWKVFENLLSESSIPIYALGGVVKQDLKKAKFAGAQGVAGIRTFCKE